MTEEMKDRLIAAGAHGLLEKMVIGESGFGGVNRDGQIVDRRIDADAVPIAKNSLLGVPEPKKTAPAFLNDKVL